MPTPHFSEMEAIRAAGKVPVTTDTYESMAKTRYVRAVGINFALQGTPETAPENALSDGQTWDARASCSSGAELEDFHIMVLASSGSNLSLRATSSHMRDAIDATTIVHLLEKVRNDTGKVVQVFAKAEAAHKHF